MRCNALTRRSTLLGLPLLVLGSIWAGCDASPIPAETPQTPATQGYASTARCGVCHGPYRPARIHQTYHGDWGTSAHGKTTNTMPSEKTIVGDADDNGTSDFRDGLDLATRSGWRAWTVSGGAAAELAPRLGFEAATARYTVTIGSRVFEVTSVLGIGRHQQTYLTRLGASSYVLPLVYRVQTRAWEPLDPENWYEWDDLDADERIDVGEQVQAARYATDGDTPVAEGRTRDAWERRCAGCHVTGIRAVSKNAGGEFLLDYRDEGVGCEACHGPGRLHDLDLGGRSSPDRAIVQPGRLPADRQRDLCTSCHTRGSSVGHIDGDELAYPWRADDTPFVPGQPLAEAFTIATTGTDSVHALQGSHTHRGDAASTYGTWSHDCLDCHSAHDTTNLALIRLTIQTPSSGAKGVVFTRRSGTTGSGGLMGDATDGKFTDVCEVCHTRTRYFRNDASTANQDHFDGRACTDCHLHEKGFLDPESEGGLDCRTCHADLASAMSVGPGEYRHLPLDTAATYPTAPTTIRCLSCHVDHDLFRPDLPNGSGRGANLRSDIAVVPTPSTGTANSDFSTAGTGGICLSCHTGVRTKSYVRSDGSTVTPAIPYEAPNAEQIAAYAAGVHGGSYQVPTQFRGGGTNTLLANCSKCHNDDLVPKSGVGAQTGSHAFGLHAATHARMLAPLGSTRSVDPLEEDFCFRCHSSVADPVGGTVKPRANQDWYDVQSMSSRQESLFASFGKSSVHPVRGQAGRHLPVEGLAAGWNPATARHVECEDCHNPHATGPGRSFQTTGTFAQPLVPSNLASGTPLQGVWGVNLAWPGAWQIPDPASAYQRLPTSTYTWQVCLKCHSGYAYGATPPAGQTDQAREFNPANPSYHAVIGASRTTYPPNGSFVSPWTRSSPMSCSVCHTPDTKTAGQGPHGSSHDGILAGPFNDTTGRTTTSGHLCFKCHDFNVYGENGSSGATATGFSGAHGNLHTFHMGEEHTRLNRKTTCVDCHAAVPHGWQRRSLLVVMGDPPPYASSSAALSASDVAGWPVSGNWRESDCSNAECH